MNFFERTTLSTTLLNIGGSHEYQLKSVVTTLTDEATAAKRT